MQLRQLLSTALGLATGKNKPQVITGKISVPQLSSKELIKRIRPEDLSNALREMSFFKPEILNFAEELEKIKFPSTAPGLETSAWFNTPIDLMINSVEQDGENFIFRKHGKHDFPSDFHFALYTLDEGIDFKQLYKWRAVGGNPQLNLFSLVKKLIDRKNHDRILAEAIAMIEGERDTAITAAEERLERSRAA